MEKEEGGKGETLQSILRSYIYSCSRYVHCGARLTLQCGPSIIVAFAKLATFVSFRPALQAIFMLPFCYTLFYYDSFSCLWL